MNEELTRQRKERAREPQTAAALLSGVMDSTTDLIAVLDRDFRYLTFNNAFRDEFLKIFGVVPHVGDSVVDSLAALPAEQGGVQAILKRARAGEAFSTIREFGDPKRARNSYEIRYIPVRDADGSLGGSAFFIRDVTAAVRAEQALRASRNDLALAQSVAHIGSWRLDLRQNRLEWSDETSRIFGLEPNAIRDLESYLERVHPDDQAVVRESWEAALSGEAAYDIEHRILTPEGVKWVRERGLLERDADGVLAYGFGTVQDITTAKRAEHSLARQNAVQQAIGRIFREVLKCETEEDLGMFCLALAEEITGSLFGFIGEVGPEDTLDNLAISDPGWAACGMRTDAEGKKRFLPTGLPMRGLYGRVIRKGVPLLTNDPDGHPDAAGRPEGHPVLTAFLGVPLLQQGRVVGMMGLGNKPGGYDQSDVEAAQSLAEAMAEALFRRRAEAALKRSERKLSEELEAARQLQQVSVLIAGADAPEAVYGSILESARVILGADMASLQVFHPEQGREGRLFLSTTRGFDAANEELWRWVDRESPSPCAEALRTLSRVVVPDTRLWKLPPGQEKLGALFGEGGIRAMQSTPLFSRSGAVLGVLSTQWRQPHAPSERELRSLDLLARQTADLIDRNQAEQGLRRSEERYRLLFESIDEGFCIIEVLFDAEEHPVDFRFLEVNPAFVAQTGIRDAVGRRMREIAADHEQFWYDVFGRIALTGEAQRFEHQAAALGFYYDVYAFRIGLPEERRVAVLFRDISDRRRAEQALRDGEEKFRDLADNISQFAWMTDHTGWVQWYNRRWFDYTGTTSEEMRGWGWQKVHHPEHVERVVAHFRECLAKGVPWEDTFPLRGRDGRYRWFLSRAVPIRDEDGRILRWFGTNTDITELRAKERQLKRAKRAAERANRAKSDFLASMSHELRTPMNGIIGLTELALMREPGGELAEYLGLVRQSAFSLLDIINDVLDLSKIEAGRVELARKAFRPRAMLEGLFRTMGLDAERKGLSFQARFGDALPGAVRGDEGRLRQIFVNLIGNAVKYTESGSVTVVVDAEAVEGEGRDGLVALAASIQDTGIGIAPDKLKEIFEPFSTAGRHARYGGTGLGLTITRQIVELMGGHISVTSEPGQGSAFSFWVLLEQAPEEAVAVSPGPGFQPMAALRPLRVLVAEDNAVNRLLVVNLLEAWGHEAVTVENGREALEALRQASFDLVLMDVLMPEMDGEEATRRIRAGEAGDKAIPIVALTAYALDGDRERFLAAGMDEHLAKPIVRAELERVLARLTER